MLYLLHPRVTAGTQLLDKKVAISKRWSAMTDIVKKVQVFHQSKLANKVRAGKMRQLRCFYGENHKHHAKF